MELSIGFDKDFERTLKRLKKKYGENSAQLHTILTPFYQSIAVIA